MYWNRLSYVLYDLSLPTYRDNVKLPLCWLHIIPYIMHGKPYKKCSAFWRRLIYSLISFFSIHFIPNLYFILTHALLLSPAESFLATRKLLPYLVRLTWAHLRSSFHYTALQSQQELTMTNSTVTLWPHRQNQCGCEWSLRRERITRERDVSAQSLL